MNPNKKDKISNLEIFGPVVTINEYENFDDAVDLANSVDVSFQASIFSDNVNEVLKFYEKSMHLLYFIMNIQHLELIGCHLLV